MRFRHRLTAVSVALLALATVASGLYAARLLERAHIAELRDALAREGKLIMTADGLGVNWTDFPTAEPSDRFGRLAAELKQVTGARITLIRSDGVVLGDSDADARSMDNHADRPEVVAARREGIGYAIRHSDTVDADMLYVAVAVPAGDTWNAAIRGDTTAVAAPVGFVRLSLPLGSVAESVRALWFGLAAGFAVSFLVAAFVMWRVAGGLTRPLERIARAAERMAAMDFSGRLRFRRDDEIGKVARTLDAMADRLERQIGLAREEQARLNSVLSAMAGGVALVGPDGRLSLVNPSAERMLGLSPREWEGRSFEELRRASTELVRLVRTCLERREPIREEIRLFVQQERIVEVQLVPLEGAGDVLLFLYDMTAVRRLEQIRSEFVANVSHELKTPIAAVKGFAETLLSGAIDDREAVRAFLKIIFDESDRLNRLIGDLLELSKIESRQIELRFSPVHLAPFVRETVDLIRAAAEAKRIELEVDIPEDIYLEADEDRLRQILLNLLSNGIQYTPEGGKVSVRAEWAESREGGGENGEEPSRVRIAVEDTGIGIPKQDLPRIFERFYRVDKARSRASGGTGLGLSIVRHLVEAHGGTISVESELGVGSTFTLELPVLQ